MAQTTAKPSFGPALVIMGPRCPSCAVVGPALTSIGLRGRRAPLMAPCGSSLVVVVKGQWWLKTGGAHRYHYSSPMYCPKMILLKTAFGQ